MQPGGQNPFQLGNKNQLFGLRPNTDSEMQVSQNQPFGSRTTTTQITLPSSQPMFGVMAGGSHGFGSPPTFSTPIATMANSREPVSTGKQVQSSSTHPVFGSAFQSQTMAGLSGNSENLKPRSTFSFTGSPLNQNRPTMFSNQIGFGGQQQQQQPVRPLFPGAFTSTTIPNTLPRLGGTFQQSSLHHISSKPKNDVEVEHMVHPPSTAPSTSSLFGQKFGTVTSSTNIFGGTSKDSSNQGDRHSPAAPQFVTNTTDGIPKKDSTRESNQRESPVHHGGPPSHDGTPSKSTSVVEDQKKSVKTFSKQRESVYKPLIQRKNVLFARAMAGVGRGDRPRVRLPSKDDRPSADPRIKKGSGMSLTVRRGSISVDPGETTRLPSQEIEQLTSIICKGIPDHLNNKPTLLEHFGKFGIIAKVYCSLQKQAATIHFKDHMAAALAKDRGSVIKAGEEPVLILWSKVTSTIRPKPKTEPPKNVSKDARLSSRSYIKDSQVSDELQAMSQGDTLEAPKILARPKELPSRPPNPKLPPLDASEFTQDSFLMPANTAEERYKLLDNRDKVLRSKLKKQSDITTAKATIGTCPDMCPEKERYMRAFQNQLHSYEMKSNDNAPNNLVVDHHKVIKEYSRSSADQEEPLPHELRPSNVLTMTMDYLVCNVMDLYEDGRSSAEDWYDFLWNRTRGIRKDITQQHLCDQSAVMLVEKCARFHIHCAERLCEEDMSTFDQKINNENLTNCLQTLKHLYADLETKCEYCPSEPEFRAYDVLLNLNEGDILRQVQLLEQRVRESPEVVEALGFYSALNNNNYVRFFKLLQRTTYLNACILQRYFTQVRLKALLSILKAYSPPNHSGQFPVIKLVSMLAFENEMEALEFFQLYGLQTENGNLILDRSAFYQPESFPLLKRARQIIDSKRHCSVGEVINHGSLPKNPLLYHVPHNSFDSQGVLRKEAFDVRKDNEKLSSADVASVVLPIKGDSLIHHPRNEDRNRNLVEVVEVLSDDLINEEVAVTVRSLAFNLLNSYYLIKTTSLEILIEIFNNVCGSAIREIAKSVLQEERTIELEARRRREQEELAQLEHIRQLKEEWASEILENVIDVVVKFKASNIAEQEIREQLELERQRCINSSTLQLSNEFWETWVSEMLTDICRSVHLEITQVRKATLERVSQKLDLWRSASFVSKWRNFVAKRKRARRSMETFPSSSLTSKKSKFQKGIGPKNVYSTSPLQIVAHRNQLDRLLDMNILNCDLRKTMSGLKIDVLSVAKDFIPSSVSQQRTSPPTTTMSIRKRKLSMAHNIYWKVAVYFFGGCGGSGNLQIVAEWLRSKLPESESLSKTDIIVIDPNNDHFKTTPTAVCIKILDNVTLSSSDSKLSGTQGFLLVFEDQTVNYKELFWENLRKQLKSLLDSKPPSPPVPLAILAVGTTSLDTIATNLHLEDFLKADSVSDCYVSILPMNMLEPNSTHVLLSSFQWLAEHCPPSPILTIESFGHFLATMITTCFTSLICHYVKRENSTHLFNLPPDIIISAFNHAIDHAATVVSDDALRNISWPPLELTSYTQALPDPQWNSRINLQKLKTLMLSYRLPMFGTHVLKMKEWNDVCNGVWNYINNFADDNWTSIAVLASRIQKVLDRSYDLFQKLDNVLVMPHDVFQWLDLIHVIVDFKLQTATMLDIDVVYDSQKAESFIISQEWKSAAQKHSIHIEIRISASPVAPSKRKLEFFDDKGREQKRKIIDDPFRTLSEEEELQHSYQDLMQQLKEEKRRWLEFDQLLKQALQDDNDFQTN